MYGLVYIFGYTDMSIKWNCICNNYTRTGKEIVSEKGEEERARVGKVASAVTNSIIATKATLFSDTVNLKEDKARVKGTVSIHRSNNDYTIRY